jgi:predicted HTH transcriptional regulator
MSESNRIEFKRDLNDKLEKEVVAFLNYKEGGIIYLGVGNDGTLHGILNADEVQLKIKDRLKNNILPSCLGLFDIIIERRVDFEIIKIIVASGPEKPYYLKKHGMSENGCYIRIGSASEPMPVRIIEKLFANRTRNSLGRIRSDFQSLKFEQLRIYYEESGRKLNNQFSSNLGLYTTNKEFNYVAFLMSDVNSISIKVAKYGGANRVKLIENNEYGYCSLIKATKQVLDKIELENKTRTKILFKKRIDTRLWNSEALREAIINAIVHNDYTNEVPPKFEIFNDRIEITSAGGLPDDLSREEFFNGFSVPRNQEIMRIFKDLEMVEQLGSGIPRILEAYDESSFTFSENFLRMTFPNNWNLYDEADIHETTQVTTPVATPDTTQVTNEVRKLLIVFVSESSREELKRLLNLINDSHFKKAYLKPALDFGLIEMTIPDKPNSRFQKYRLTNKGKEFRKKQLKNK